MYKVFIENKPFIFTSTPSGRIIRTLKTNKSGDVQKLISQINSVPAEGVEIICIEPENLFKRTFKDYEEIEAAGGVVAHNGAFLLIYRLGMWDLPKGKRELNESPQECALREIEEECGIHGHQLMMKLEETWHTYRFKKREVIKRTYWFGFNYLDNEVLVPQLEEDIQEARWVKLEELDSYKGRMYPSLHSVIDSAIEKIKNGTVFEKGMAE